MCNYHTLGLMQLAGTGREWPHSKFIFPREPSVGNALAVDVVWLMSTEGLDRGRLPLGFFCGSLATAIERAEVWKLWAEWGDLIG